MEKVEFAETQQVAWAQIQLPAGMHQRRSYYYAKRTLDLVGASLVLIALSPLLLLAALAIRLDSPGPIIFGQQRMGYDRRTGRLKPFGFLKLRSMVHNADTSVHAEYVKAWINGNGGNGSSNGHNKEADLRADRRLTRVGRLLRRSSLDEVPQLWNVVRGEMSLVGPRPVPLYEVAEYKPHHIQRLAATPGITGMWQVKMRGHGSIDDMTALDMDYIARQSLWLDLEILARTIPAVIKGSGAA